MIHQTRALDVAQWLADGVSFTFIDVRTPGEYAVASVPGAVLLSGDNLETFKDLPKNTRMAFLCHHGVRSQSAAQAFASFGFTDLHNVVGGIEAWSRQVDSSIPRY